jgi:sphingomyelin phosphodiesterase acid-like 3
MNSTNPGANRRLLSATITLLLFLALICTGELLAQPKPSNTFLIAADIHFNPMADPSLVADLNRATPTQWESILARSKRTTFSQYGEDTNWWLLASSLDAMRSTLQHPAFIMVAGDILAHRFPSTFADTAHDTDREHYREFVLKTVEFLALEFRKRFPDTPILLTPGNNDEDCGNYTVEAGGAFLHDTAELARKLAHGDDEVKSSWEHLGSYDIPHPVLHGVRIVSMNTVFLNYNYQALRFSDGCAPVPSSAASELFTWLESRLNKAQQAHQKVWLLFHIPPGMDSYYSIQSYQSLLKKTPHPDEKQCTSALVPMWAPQWTEKFQALLQKYKGTVIAAFAAHNHRDDFRLISLSSEERVFVLLTPAISPVYNQNPAFRSVTFASDGSISDSSIYYLTNIEYAGSRTAGEWKREYTFSQEWKMKQLNAANLAAIYNQVASQEAARGEWLKLYNVSTAIYMPPNSTPALYCAVEGLVPESYGKCYCSAVVSSSPAATRP